MFSPFISSLAAPGGGRIFAALFFSHLQKTDFFLFFYFFYKKCRDVQSNTSDQSLCRRAACGQQVKLRTTLITKHTTAALNIPPWLQCTWVGNINKDTDEEERNTGGCWPPATHTALSLDAPRRLRRAALTATTPEQ